ncbi:MAG: hypothetical protein AAGM67_21730, partial [Bacteroidota bacterium]
MQEKDEDLSDDDGHPLLGHGAVPKPDKPILGHFCPFKYKSTSEFVPYVGGEPKPDWSGLVEGPTHPFPTRLRPQTVKAATIGFQHRQKGFEDRFTTGSNLDSFLLRVNDHLVRHGLDTIAYRQSSNDGSMKNVVSHYTAFEVDQVREDSLAIAAKWDSYSREDNECAFIFLRDSLSPAYFEELQASLDPTDTFADLFMLFIRTERNFNANRW